jgi:SsrA-binding protein
LAKKPKKDEKPANLVVVRNRRARFDYHLELTVEAGIALQGTEVKSLRARLASLDQAWARVFDREVFLVDANIPEYLPGSWTNHLPKRKRKLLLHRSEIRKIEDLLKPGGRTLVPLEIYFTPKGIAKVLLAVATGKKHHDKREALAKKDAEREISRALRR